MLLPNIDLKAKIVNFTGWRIQFIWNKGNQGPLKMLHLLEPPYFYGKGKPNSTSYGSILQNTIPFFSLSNMHNLVLPILCNYLFNTVMEFCKLHFPIDISKNNSFFEGLFFPGNTNGLAGHKDGPEVQLFASIIF